MRPRPPQTDHAHTNTNPAPLLYNILSQQPISRQSRPEDVFLSELSRLLLQVVCCEPIGRFCSPGEVAVNSGGGGVITTHLEFI